MSLVSNNLNLKTIKISQLGSYTDIKPNDILLVIQSSSYMRSKKTTFMDLITSIGQISADYKGSFIGDHSGSTYGYFQGNGIFDGVHRGTFINDTVGSIMTGSFNGDFKGIFKGTFSGSLSINNLTATGSYYGNIFGQNTKATGSFTGNHYGTIIGRVGSKITGSFKGNLNGTANNSNTSLYASQAGNALTANTAKTASYVLQTGAGQQPLYAPVYFNTISTDFTINTGYSIYETTNFSNVATVTNTSWFDINLSPLSVPPTARYGMFIFYVTASKRHPNPCSGNDTTKATVTVISSPNFQDVTKPIVWAWTWSDANEMCSTTALAGGVSSLVTLPLIIKNDVPNVSFRIKGIKVTKFNIYCAGYIL